MLTIPALLSANAFDQCNPVFRLMSNVPRNVPNACDINRIPGTQQRDTHDTSFSDNRTVDSEDPTNFPIPPSQFNPPVNVIPHAVPMQGPGVSYPMTNYAPPVTSMPLLGPGVPPSTSCAGVGYVPTAMPVPPPSTSAEEPLPKDPTTSPPHEEETDITPKRAARAARVKDLRSKKYTNPQKMFPLVGFSAK